MMTNDQCTQEPVRQGLKTWKKPELKKLCLSQAAACNMAGGGELENSGSKALS
jgi:hypothetical protein